MSCPEGTSSADRLQLARCRGPAPKPWPNRSVSRPSSTERALVDSGPRRGQLGAATEDGRGRSLSRRRPDQRIELGVDLVESGVESTGGVRGAVALRRRDGERRHGNEGPQRRRLTRSTAGASGTGRAHPGAEMTTLAELEKPCLHEIHRLLVRPPPSRSAASAPGPRLPRGARAGAGPRPAWRGSCL